MLDASCQGLSAELRHDTRCALLTHLSQPNLDLVDKGMVAAIGMAQAVFDVLDRRPWNTPGNPDQIYSDLANWLLKEDGSTAHVPQVPPVDPVDDTRDNLSQAQVLDSTILHELLHSYWGKLRKDIGYEREASIALSHRDSLWNAGQWIELKDEL
ncbi:hypothetical protein BDZ45DRAFT_751507 [Acephala macrosclerotiorum]|nr:hypothetical protein BDZ45DRAFT_751507 [Acephala macrosclerotiorum]